MTCKYTNYGYSCYKHHKSRKYYFYFKKLTTDTALDYLFSGPPPHPTFFVCTFFGCLILSQQFYIFNGENRKIIQSFLRMDGSKFIFNYWWFRKPSSASQLTAADVAYVTPAPFFAQMALLSGTDPQMTVALRSQSEYSFCVCVLCLFSPKDFFPHWF